MINSGTGMVTDHQTVQEIAPGVLVPDVREKLRRSGYTLTSQRRAVLEALSKANGHPSAEDVYLEPHLDIRCIRCGEVSEVPGVALGGVEERIRNNTPYRVTRATMVVEGLCPACIDS